MNIYLAAFGNAKGDVSIDGETYSVDGKQMPVPIGDLKQADRICLQPQDGKFGDSEDSFIFLCTPIDPRTENFELSGRFQIQIPAGEKTERQDGYGILAADTIASGQSICRYRNHIALGRGRMNSAFQTGCGMRVVAGYRDPDAIEFGSVRKIDTTRFAQKTAYLPEISDGESFHFLLKKKNEGFTGEITGKEGNEQISFPGCDFLMKQDPERIYAGFAAAGRFILTITEIHFSAEKGQISATPDEALHSAIPDYPFSLKDLPEDAGKVSRDLSGDLFCAPAGKADADGTEQSPLDLQTALNSVRPGRQIILMDGIYEARQPFIAGKDNSGAAVSVKPQHPGEAILDGSPLAEIVPVMILSGENWHIQGLIFQNSPSAGLFICGKHNLAERCEARKNQDTGILICSMPGSLKENWPAFNEVRYCDSYDNCDDERNQADGFGAKLSVGEGNRFFECIAHHNADDGFDLYTKSFIGPISPVTIENCIAYENGHLSGETGVKTNIKGFGFKFGGENQPAAHRIRNCLAYNNDGAGFASNSNPEGILEDLIAWENGVLPMRCNFRLSSENTAYTPGWQFSGLFPEETVYFPNNPPERQNHKIGKKKDLYAYYKLMRKYEDQFITCDMSVTPTRKADGTIDRHGLFVKIQTPADRQMAEEYRKRYKRLMFIIPRLSGGGAEKMIAALASSMAEKHTVYLVLTAPKDRQTPYPVSDRVHKIQMPKYEKPAAPQPSGPAQQSAVQTGVRGSLKALSGKVKELKWKVLGDCLPVLHRFLPERFFSDMRRIFLRYPDKESTLFYINELKQIKQDFAIDCAVSFLNSSNYINARSKVGEYNIISFRSCLEGPFAPPEVKTLIGKQQVLAACKYTDKVTAVSKETAAGLIRNWGVRKKKVSVVYNFLDLDQIRERSREAIEEPEILDILDHAGFVFFSNGRITTKKGQWHLVRAFRKVHDLYPSSVLLILGAEGKGADNTMKLVMQTIRENHLEDAVFLLGFHINPHKYLAHADAFVLSSFNEGFPNALVEAMALGIPVISTDCRSGPREILAPDTDCTQKTRTLDRAEYGILIPECSGERKISEPLEAEEEIMAEAMLSLVKEPDLRAHYAGKSAERAGQFSKETFLHEWETLIMNSQTHRSHP